MQQRAKSGSAAAWAVAFASMLWTCAAHGQQCHPYQASVSSGYFGAWGNTPAQACQSIVAAMPHPKLTNGGAVSSDVSFAGVQQTGATSYNCLLHEESHRVSDGAVFPGVDFALDGVSGPACSLKTAVISLAGATRTKALAAGPVLPQVATVTQDGAPAVGKTVSIGVQSGGTVTGLTDGAGQMRFTYIPPQRRARLDLLTATCDSCVNVAQEAIVVDSPDMCERGVGNPIQPGSGEKVQTEEDWTDNAAHPLTFIRTYRSGGNVTGAGIASAPLYPSQLNASMGGAPWSHNFAGRLELNDPDAAVRLGDGSKVLLRRDTAGLWRADNVRDLLVPNDAGYAYVRASDDTRWQFDRFGVLQAIVERNGWTMALSYNPSGQLVSVTNAAGRQLTFEYNPLGLLTFVHPPDGATLQYGYDSSLRLRDVVYIDARSRQYGYDDRRWPNALTGIVDENNKAYATFTYDAQGRAVSTQHAGGAFGYTVDYGASSAPTAVGSLALGTSIDASVYRSGAQVTDPLGNVQSFGWTGGSGRMVLTSGSGAYEGNTVASRTLDTTGLPTLESDYLNVQTLYGWDTARQLPVSTTEAANTPQARTTQIQWHPTYRLPLLVSEAGRSAAYRYDERGNELERTVTDTATGRTRRWRWTYHASGLVETLTDPRQGTWSYGYDAAGNRTSVKDPMGRVTLAEYDTAGRVVKQTDADGLVTAYGYDLRGRLIAQQRAGELTRFTYTPAGLLESVTQPDGYQVVYSWDDAHRLVAAADNRDSVVAYTLDAAGNRVHEEVRDAAGNIALATSRTINALNKVAMLKGSRGSGVQFAYDANGELTGETDALNHSTIDTLDALRRPAATQYADAGTTRAQWNALDQLEQFTDARGVATRYTRNAFGEVLTESSPDIGTVRYTRDDAGDIIAIEDAAHQTTRIQRDALGRPTRLTYGADNEILIGYDAMGRAGGFDDASGSTRFTRDALGRITFKSQTVAGDSRQYALGYSYDRGDLASVTYPSGMVVLYRRGAGRIGGIDVQIPEQQGRKRFVQTSAFVSGLAYTALGQPRSWSWASGDSATRTFDADGRMTTSEVATFGYDDAGRITSLTQNLWATRPTDTTPQLYEQPVTWSVGYDSRDRITSFTRAGASSTYTYDANANRLTSEEITGSEVDLEGTFDQPGVARMAGQTLAIEPTSNRLLGFTQTLTTIRNGQSTASSKTSVAYGIDENGSITSDGLRGFGYDELGRLSQVTAMHDGEVAAVEYLYNAASQRVFKSEPRAEQAKPGKETLGRQFIKWVQSHLGWVFPASAKKAALGRVFVYGDEQLPGWALLGEYDNGGANAKDSIEYIWLPTEDGGALPVGLVTGGKLYAIHPDHLGTPRLITDAKNKAVWQWPYSAFGSNRPTGPLARAAGGERGETRLKATSPGVETNLRLPGQYGDSESNLFYNGFRYYQQTQGRYSQADPAGLNGGKNRFIYAGGNSISYIDPTGKNAVAGAEFGAETGFAIAGPPGAVAGGILGAIGGYVVADHLGNLIFNRPKNPPDIGPPNGWIQGPRRGRQYCPDGTPQFDIDKPHQGNEQDHVHQWPGGIREEPGRPVSPWPRQPASGAGG
ncbi:MAG TPA: RHS repeat-associated core domain-containing protein [Ramlibacter sp.]|uniref:RHS repeat-associated core domain-containing protein n=1 Tax=Ramlibacter sp. TaxID=1917967 RepID=UPI002CAD42F4|nr:RHS repeat-associated core domain-containing protein [Ramlibacter sp.]HVZ42320.1 RHS repeat-associated core domain-containing protein [Ramlibacter sp.]